MQADTLLTQDELDFIQDLQHAPSLNLADGMSSLQVNGERRLQQLITRLVANEQVTLQAQFNNQQISFPLQLVEDEFHALHLQLGSPAIYEDGPTRRPWRLSMDTPTPLLDPRGSPTALLVRDISFKGVLLQVEHGGLLPNAFALQFAPGNLSPIPLEGVLRRRIGPDLAAYDLSRTAPEQVDRLRDYILQAHRQAHPELHRR